MPARLAFVRSLALTAAALCLAVACSSSGPRAERSSASSSPLPFPSTTTTSLQTTTSTTCADAPLSAAAGSASVLGTVDLTASQTIGFVSAGSGAAADVVDVYVHGPCGWARQLELPIGGTVTHLDGARCADGALIVLQARSDDGTTYTTSAQRYTVTSGPALTRDGQPVTGTVGASDPSLADYAGLDCPGVTPPS